MEFCGAIFILDEIILYLSDRKGKNQNNVTNADVVNVSKLT